MGPPEHQVVVVHEVQQDVQDQQDQPVKLEHQEVLELKDGEVFKVQLDKKVNKDHQENKDWEDPKDLLDQSVSQDQQEPEDHQDHQDQPRTPSAANTSPPCCHLSERSSQSKNEQAAAATKDSQWDTSN